MSRRITAGAMVLIASRLIARCIDLATLLVLARLLSPADFGLVAIAMSIIMTTEAVFELPVWQALVRLPMTKAHFDTAFTLALLRSLAVVLVLFAIAWPVAQIYGEDRLIPLVCALAFAPASRGLGSARMIEYVKKLDYRRDFVLEFTGKIVAFTVSVSLAWWTQSYWSLVVGTIAAPVTMVVVSYVLAPYWPRLTLRKWRRFASFLGWSSASQAVNSLNWQMDQLMLGRFVDRTEFGRFSMAANLAALPSQVFAQVLSPLMVTFSLIRDDSRRLTSAYQNSATTILAVGVPIMIGLSAISEPLIRLILGGQWAEAAPILRWLSLAAIPAFFVAPLAPLFMALNRTEVFLRLTLTELVFKLPIVFVGAVYYGVAGIVVARLATALFVAGFSAVAVRELIGLPLRTQVFGPWRPILSGLAMGLAIMPMVDWLASVHGLLPLILGLTAVVFVGAVVYVSSIFMLWRMAGCPEGFESKIVNMLGNYKRRFWPDAAPPGS